MSSSKQIRIVISVWAALMLCLGLTIALAAIPMGPFNTVVSMGISFIKAMLVVQFYMHLRTAIVALRLASLPAIALLGALFFIATVDYLTRVEPFSPWQ